MREGSNNSSGAEARNGSGKIGEISQAECSITTKDGIKNRRFLNHIRIRHSFSQQIISNAYKALITT